MSIDVFFDEMAGWYAISIGEYEERCVACCSDRFIEYDGLAKSLIFVPDMLDLEADTFCFSGILIHPFFEIGTGSVVGDDQFEVETGLTEISAQCPAKQGQLVVGTDDHTRGCHDDLSLLSAEISL